MFAASPMMPHFLFLACFMNVCYQNVSLGMLLVHLALVLWFGPHAILYLAFLLLLVCLINAKYRCFRLSLLLVTLASLLGCSVAGVFHLVLHPRLLGSLLVALYLTRILFFCIASKVDPCFCTHTDTRARLSQVNKTQQRRAQKRQAKRRRMLVLSCGGHFVLWFERFLQGFLFIMNVCLPLLTLLVTGRVLCHVLSLAGLFLIAVDKSLQFLASLLHVACWISCVLFYFKLLHCLNAGEFLTGALDSVTMLLQHPLQAYSPCVLIALSMPFTPASMLVLGLTFAHIHAPSVLLCRSMSSLLILYQLWRIVPVPTVLVMACLGWLFGLVLSELSATATDDTVLNLQRQNLATTNKGNTSETAEVSGGFAFSETCAGVYKRTL